jgi:hypothetical protein
MGPIVIVMSLVFGGAIVVYLSVQLYVLAVRALGRKLESDMSPVVAEVEVISQEVVTPRNNSSTIASVFSIEQITPSPKKKKKKRSNSSSSVTSVLPFATHVSDHIPVAETV